MIGVHASGIHGGSLGKSQEDLIYNVSLFCIEHFKLERFKAMVHVKQHRSRKLMDDFAIGYSTMDIIDTDQGKYKWGTIELVTQPKAQFIKTLIHEWVHIKQYLRGELSMTGHKWKKQDESHLDYEDQSCEKEAYKLQEELYELWLTSNRL